jgi:DNA polymerase-3 subunit epsilon
MGSISRHFKSLFRDTAAQKASRELKSKKITDVAFVVIDLETSGLDISRDKVLSFGGIKIENRSVIVSSSMEKVFKQSSEVLPGNVESATIHGLLGKDTAGGEDKRLGIKEVVEFIGDGIIVGHHISFDLLMLKKVTHKYLNKTLTNLSLDTAHLAARLEQGAFADTYIQGQYGLDQLCERYNLEPFDRHTAAGDAFLTAQLLIKLLDLADRKGIQTLGQLLEKRKSGLY